ncbi:glycosyltransferase involved in cell wall biosynthesis [Undibacterium sp. GrIS 1.2]|uniref:glycosyltransferase n=1 Tax=Undibacterium sp. GrIS 1.2 TaxID=3143933 RepID=UPI0033974FD3
MNSLNKSFEEVTAASTLNELLSFYDESFIYCCYRTLLGRDPDEAGLAYYLHRIRGGEQKMQILAEVSASPEAVQLNVNVKGLRSGIRFQKLARDLGFRQAPKQVKKQEEVVATTFQITEEIPDLEPLPKAQLQPVPAVTVVRTSTLPRLAHSIENPELIAENLRTIWVDLTTSLQWTGGVVGIIRAELEIACGMYKVDDSVRFSMQIENGFVEIQKDQLQWLLNAENVADAYMNFFGRYQKKEGELKPSEEVTQQTVTVQVPNTTDLYFPFRPGDIVIAVGWMDSRKEEYFSKVKEVCPDIVVGYLVYDIILLLKETTHFYDQTGCERFKEYIKWISHNCDFMLFGGETAKQDTQSLQAEMEWPTPMGSAVKFGTDIMKSVEPELEPQILADIGIIGPFIMTVGSIEPRKNHDTIYRAYLLALEMSPETLPQLVICGKPMWRAEELVDTIERDPRLKGKVIRFSPTDTQLAVLYKHCKFTLLPSLYEGWSLTLPESLGQGKFCLCNDTPPLREIGGDLIDYAPKWDVKSWAEKIVQYSNDKKLLATYEQKINEHWPKIRWQDTAITIRDEALRLVSRLPVRVKSTLKHQPVLEVKPVIWLDITLAFIYLTNGMSGIIRTELNYAKYLKSVSPNTRYFAYDEGYFFEVLPEFLLWLFDDVNLTASYKMFQSFWKKHESEGTGYRNPFRATNGPVVGHPAYLDKFPDNSVVLFVGIDSDQNGEQHRVKDVLKLTSGGRNILTSHLVYDLTPFLYPQFHLKVTCDGYRPFIEHLSNNFDHLLYGGRTAQRDGIKMQELNGWKSPPSDFVEFGSDLTKNTDESILNQANRDVEILQGLGVRGRFIITVGTIEPRKNHEMLYKAYITLLESKGSEDLPQLLFVGNKGWKTKDFLDTFDADKRIKDQIILMTPSDEELDVLYRYCLFTLLPSFYEGWSLTLPESLSYGKFCLTSDVDPLKETGGDLVEYINPLDTYSWANRIYYYATHPKEIAVKEAYIKRHWKPKTWRESTEMLTEALYAAHKARRINDSLNLAVSEIPAVLKK